MWTWKYSIGDRVRIKESCKWAYPNIKSKTGVISELHKGKLYDYDVQIEGDIWTVRLKEDEIDIVED